MKFGRNTSQALAIRSTPQQPNTSYYAVKYKKSKGNFIIKKSSTPFSNRGATGPVVSKYCILQLSSCPEEHCQ
jgi:hypothetical protein